MGIGFGAYLERVVKVEDAQALHWSPCARAGVHAL